MFKRKDPDHNPGMDRKIRFGARLKAIRAQRGLTQERLAELIDRSVDAVSNMERGNSLPSLDTLLELSEKLDLPLRDLVDSLEGRGDPDRVGLETTLVELSRKLDRKHLLIAIDQVAAMVKHTVPADTSR